MLTKDDIREAATALEEALAAARPMAPLSERWVGMDIADAYAVQEIVAADRLAAGARRVGWKVGLTSKPMRDQLGVDQPDFGPLLEDMQIADGGVCPVDDLIAPRVEGEIAFRLSRDLDGEGLTEADVLEACDLAVPSLEIIDSRILDWKIAITDTIADGASSARYVVGSGGCPPGDVDLTAVTMRLLEDEREVEQGIGAAVLGHPARAVAWLAGTLSRFGEHLAAGDVILAGSLTAAIPAHPGTTVVADFGEPLGSVAVTFGMEAGA